MSMDVMAEMSGKSLEDGEDQSGSVPTSGNSLQSPTALATSLFLFSNPNLAGIPHALVATSGTGNAISPTHTFLTIPLEIRDEILKLVLTKPVNPNFEKIKNPTKKYKNYFSIAFVNRQLYIETREASQLAKNLVIISTNWEGLASALEGHAIPIVSDHHINRVKHHAMRIHVKFPLNYTNKKVRSSVLVLANELPYLSILFRALSLDLPHPPLNPPPGLINEFPRMSMILEFEKMANGSDIPIQKQQELVKLLARMNRIGKIKILGVVDESVRKLLPGHDETFQNSEELYEDLDLALKSFNLFRTNRLYDGRDYVTVTNWKLSLASRAHRRRNYDLATQRYLQAIDVIHACFHRNEYVISDRVPGNYKQKLDHLLFVASMCLTDTAVQMKDWDSARHHMFHIIEDMPNRPFLTDEERKAVKGLDEHIEKRARVCSAKTTMISREVLQSQNSRTEFPNKMVTARSESLSKWAFPELLANPRLGIEDLQDSSH
ncbi:hypothetical protein B7494_g5884 [Chlorociboria aeruginascens]|nr:hypothetical protein B7494_g5884 [Chlorociboria aeruginascens]